MAPRVRFAPSPTGYLHIGGLRTALFCYLFARSQGGTFVLRIEDTDRSRLVEDAEADIVASLRWAGLVVDEGPASGPGYRQSERTALYQDHVQRLLAKGHAYYAFDTPEALAAMRQDGDAYGPATRGRMLNAFTLSESEVTARIANREPHVVRLLVPEKGRIEFEDLIKGHVAMDAAGLDDQVLLKSDGFPTYHLANVVDDHHMRITHVIRGEEWLPSVPKHMLLYRAFGWEPPVMAHLPLILSPSGGKLSKRSATTLGIPVSVRDYRALEYEPEALVNFLALLGWHPSSEQEVFSMAELTEQFSLDRVVPSPARFDLSKLRWSNQQHLRLLGTAQVAARAADQVAKAFGPVAHTYVASVVAAVGHRLVVRSDLCTEYAYFFRDPALYDPRGIKRRWKADAAVLMRAYANRLETLGAFDEAQLESALRTLAKERGVGAGRIIHPARLAVSGTTAGPSLFVLLAALGREACVRRLRRAAAVLG